MTDDSHQFVALLAGAIQAELGTRPQDARRIALALLRWMAQRVDVLYCPKTLDVDRATRDDAIRREFNGHNREELCRRHKVARSTFYRIVSRGGR